MDDITASIIVQCQTSGAAASINKLGFSLAMLGKKAFQFGVQAVQEFRGTQDAAWKFGKTFANTMGTAERAVNEFMDSYNLSEKTARSMLTDTAQVLKGFGFSEREALKLSEQVSRMGVDMASFTGYAGGAKGAVEAITAGMLGETERLKGLGTVIRMDSEEFRNMTAQIRATKGVSEQQARAMATLELVMQKNKDAIGDYNAEGENFTQSVNNLMQAIDQIKSDFGEIIYEVLGLNDKFSMLGGGIKDFAKKWRDTKDEWIYSIRLMVIETETFVSLVIDITKPIWSSIIAGIKNIVTIGGWFYENWSKIWLNIGDIMKAVFLDWWEWQKYFIGTVVLGGVAAIGKAIAAAIKAGLKGENIGKAVMEEFSKYGSELVQGFGEQGKYTSEALKRAGTSPLPEMSFGDWDITGAIDRNLDARNRKIEEANKRLAAKRKTYTDKEITEQSNAPGNFTYLGDLAKDMYKFRATSQSAIMANSIEGMRLQSRQLLNTSVNDPMKQTEKNTKTMADKITDVKRTLDNIARAVTSNSGSAMIFSGIKVY